MNSIPPAAASQDRLPHAVLDSRSRKVKGRKIETVLERRKTIAGTRVLDVGTGSGLIAEHLLPLVGETGSVAAVDRVNQLKTDRIEFHQVNSTTLPFHDASFDIVISNHVIEHVGESDVQLHHLTEIARVLKPNGLLYLAMPNRWAPVEPHFRLALLSWLPKALRTPYVRLTGRGRVYDCEPLARRELYDLFRASGFRWEEITSEVLTLMAQHELSPRLGKAILSCPKPVLSLAMRVIPTVVYIGSKSASGPYK